MSTPRRPAPRSSAAPITATERDVSRSDIRARLTTSGMENGRINVLLADDDEGFVVSLRELIERQRELHVVATARDGVEAIEYADRLSPDAAEIDLHMPRVDGVTAIGRLREEHPNLCLIALTAYDDPELHRAVRQAGADAVLQKGEIVGLLIDRLRKVRSTG